MNPSRPAPETETRNRLIDSARSLFHARGYAAVGVADICRQAGAVKGSFYHFFSSKEDLLQACLEKNAARLGQGLSHLQEKPLNGRQRLETFISGIKQNAAQMQKVHGRILGCDVGHLAAQLEDSQLQATGTAQSALAAWVDQLADWIAQGQADGSIDPGIHPRKRAEALLALVQGMSVLGRSLNDLNMLNRIASQAAALFPEP